jgi:glutamate-ammonia-ligase adenylyltransferase
LNPQLEFAIGELHADRLVSSKIVGAQKLLTRILVMMRLVAPGDVKPTAATWQLVADACGAASWEELLAEHDVARQSVRELWDSIKREA